jgi:hypothetical protein
MDKEFWELETGKTLSEIEFVALSLGLKLLVIVDDKGNINKYHDFLARVPYARCDN